MNRYIIAFILSLLSLSADSLVLGGDGHEEANSIISSDDGYVVVGYNSSTNKTNSKNVWIVKADNKHNIIWQTYWGGIKNDGAYTITTDGKSGYIVAGFTMSKGSGDKDMLVLHIDKDGNITDEKIYGGDKYDQIKSIISVADGYILVGTMQSNSNGANDGVILKLDKKLNKVYMKSVGDRKDDNLIDIVQIGDEYIAVGDTKNNTAGSSDGCITRFDKDANMLKRFKIGGKRFEFLTSVARSSDGGYIAFGYTGTDSLGLADLFAVRYDKDDNIIWQKRYGGDKFEKAKKILALQDNTYLLIGSTKSDSHGKDDGYVIKIDQDGKIIWEKRYGGKGKDMLYNGYVKNNNKILLCGEYSSKNSSNGDLWVFVIDNDGNIVK